MKCSFPVFLGLCGLLALLTSCRTSLTHLDRQVRDMVTDSAVTVVDLPSNTLANALVKLETPLATTHVLLELDLKDALGFSTLHSRQLQKRRDDLYTAGLALLGTRRDFAVELEGTVGYVFDRDITGREADGGELALSATRILPTGGRIRLGAQSTLNTISLTNLTRSVYGNGALVRLDQPLLSGAGYSASHEDLIQGTRNLVYALRDFALIRQEFAVSAMRDYYDLVIQQAVLRNTRLNVEQSTALRERSEAMFAVQRAPSIDVLRARQQELVSINDFGRTEANYDIELRRFLLRLGLPVNRPTEITGTIPTPAELTWDEQTCIDSALARRVDLRTVADQEQDARRRLVRARNILRPELNVYGEYGVRGENRTSFGTQDLDDLYSFGITLDIPLDRRDERDAVKSAMLDLAAAIRDLATKEDEVRLEVRDNFTQLRFLKEAVGIEKMNIDIALKRAENAMFLFKSGDLLNRDVVEAENDLLDARNAYVRILAQYEIQRIELLRNSGALDIAPNGAFIEVW